MIDKNCDVISISDIKKDEFLDFFEFTKRLERFNDKEKLNLLGDCVVSTLFFEPSTRTKLSFESAALKLGARVLPFPSVESSSLSKGESFSDTIRMVDSYSDLIIIRHFLDGSARLAAEIADAPVINAGDGANQHPSQTMLDLYTIFKRRGNLNNLTIAFVGDLKYGRTVHSLAKAISMFNAKMYFVSPKSLKLPRGIREELDEVNIKYEVLEDFRDIMNEVDVLYMTRIQKERFPDLDEYEKVKGIYVADKSNIIGKSKDNMMILHPLPRVDEISTDLDDTKHALYFEQAKNGVPIRQAMMVSLLKGRIL